MSKRWRAAQEDARNLVNGLPSNLATLRGRFLRNEVGAVDFLTKARDLVEVTEGRANELLDKHVPPLAQSYNSERVRHQQTREGLRALMTSAVKDML